MIKKEINYLSLPDFFNKYLYINYNQKFDNKGFVRLNLDINSTRNIGFALKAVVQLELIFPRQVSCLLVKISKKQTFNKKSQNVMIYKFIISIKPNEFIEFARFFLNTPFAKKLNVLPLVAKKLKNFDLKYNIKLNLETTKSFEYLKMYHLN